MSEFIQRSNEIQKTGFIEERYIEFAEHMFNIYLAALHGDNLLLKIINKITSRRVVKTLYSQKALCWIRNIIECDAHRELILKYLAKGKKRNNGS